jgi:hypothetical protein
MRNIPQHWIDNVLGLLFVAFGTIIAVIMFAFSLIIPGFIVSGLLIGIGSYFYCLGDKLRIKKIIVHLYKARLNTKKRNISIEGGIYNEHIQGDFINIQGNQIYLGQDLSEFSTQIKEILNHLQSQGCDELSAKEQVIDDLKIQIPENSRIRAKMLKWKKQLGISSRNLPTDTELAERIVNFAAEEKELEEFYNSSIDAIEGKYQKLHDLLEAGEWEEADKETVRVICHLMPDHDYTDINVDQIPPKDLKKINQLWDKFSNGRFGFSVQQSIWNNILKAYNADTDRYWLDDSVYNVFIDRVGWSRESDRIYHTDIEYSLKAPRGHLPAILMFKNPWYSYYPSNYSDFNQSIFDELMEREYNRIPFIPSWLENLLFIE